MSETQPNHEDQAAVIANAEIVAAYNEAAMNATVLNQKEDAFRSRPTGQSKEHDKSSHRSNK
jgi:hypothetical protein